MSKIILDLCGGTGSWSKPYADAGYDVRVITLPEYDVLTYTPPSNVYGVLAAPPCTEFSVLNCKAEERKKDFEKGMEIVNACLNIISSCRPVFWAMENPTGYLRRFIGKPKMTYQPWQFGDPWTKRTDIWGDFNVPKKLFSKWEDVPKLPLYTRPTRGKPNLAYLHKSAWHLIPQFRSFPIDSDAAFRAITSPGFAIAFFESNKQPREQIGLFDRPDYSKP